MIELYGYPKCSTCKKAIKFLEMNDVPVKVWDITKETPSAEMIASWMKTSELPMTRFFNTSGIKYRELGLKDKVNGFTLEDASELLSTDGMLLKRPILLKEGQFILNGFKEQDYKGVLESWKKNV